MGGLWDGRSGVTWRAGEGGIPSTDEVEQGCVGKPCEWAIQRWQAGPN